MAVVALPMIPGGHLLKPSLKTWENARQGYLSIEWITMEITPKKIADGLRKKSKAGISETIAGLPLMEELNA